MRRGARQELLADLVEHPAALDLVELHLPVADERSGAHVGLHEAGELELVLGAAHRVGVDGEVDRELAHGGEAVARAQRARGDGALHLVDDLPVEGNAALQIDGDRESHWFLSSFGGSERIVMVY